MELMHTGPTQKWTSPPTDSPQFLVRVYSTPHGFVRTVATRQHVGDVWGPESEVYVEQASHL